MGTVMHVRGGGGGGGSGTLYGFDFTAMTSAQLLAAGWSISRDNAIWVPDSAGDYAEIAAGALAKSDLGVHCFGGFTNYAPNGLLDGAVAGSPGTLPTLHALYDTTRTEIALDTVKGLPVIGIKYTTGRVYAYYTAYAAQAYATRHISAVAKSLAATDAKVYAIKNGSGDGYKDLTAAFALYKVTAGGLAEGDSHTVALESISNSIPCEMWYGGWQDVLGLGCNPQVLALSSAATTVTAAQIPTLSRVTPGECSFVLPVVTSPARKGTYDVIASASLDANNQLLVIHEEADNNILLRLVTSGSTVGERDLGVVGDNVYTVVRGSVSTGRLAGALDGMEEMLEITGSGIIPPPAFTRWTLGNDHAQAAATQFWGSVLGLRIN